MPAATPLRTPALRSSGAPARLCRRLMSPSSPLVFPFTLRRPVIVIARGITAPLVEPADARRYPVLQRSRAPALRRGLSAPPDGRPNGRRGSGLRCSGAPEGHQCHRVDSGAPALRCSSATGGGGREKSPPASRGILLGLSEMQSRSHSGLRSSAPRHSGDGAEPVALQFSAVRSRAGSGIAI